MSDGGVRVESGEDRNLCRTSSRETGTGSFSVRQDGGSSDDSELYDTDVESAACEASSAEGDCIEVYLATCDRDQVAPQRAVIRGLQKHEVDVRHRCLGDQDAHALSVALCRNTSVTHLQLAGNNLGALGTVYLKTVLTLNQYITYLDLSENNLGRETSSCVALSDTLRANTRLETLILSRNNLRDQDAVYLAAGILENSQLVCLDLSRNLIAETGGVHLGRAFAINNSVDELNLSGNCIRQKGAVAICKGLQENGYVSKLDLSWNGFGYEGSLAVGELLKKNSTLTELDLSSNRINWQAIQFIANGLATNRTLEILRLDMNPLTTTGCMDLIDTISNSRQTALINLSLREVPVLSDFELVTMMIRDSRPEFTCQHGGVVNSADVVGRRLEKQMTPIEKLMQFMKEREYRTAEFFRILDKDGSKSLTHDELAIRMLKLGVRLHSHEVDELLDFVQSMDDKQSTRVNYKAMSQGVKSHQDMERMEKIREQKRDERLRRYHNDILTGPVDAISDVILPPIHDYETEEDKGRLLATLKGGAKADAIAPAHSTTGTGNVGKSVNVMSMSVSLGGKAVPFGKAAGGKKTREKKTKKKKQKNITRNYDDEGVGLA